MITKIDHIGIAVKALEERLPFWAEALGLEVRGIETVASEKVKVAFLPLGTATIELLEATDEDSPIAKQISRKGEGIHHLTLEVSDLPGSLERLRARGVQIVGDALRTGAGGRRVAFLHPRSTGGVLVELIEAGAAERQGAEIRAGATVLVYLREPQEKLWGVLRRLDASGAVVEAIDLASFDDWLSQLESDEDTVVGPSVLFVPMGRVERILLDRPSGHLPSLADRFQQRTGRSVLEVLADSAPASDD